MGGDHFGLAGGKDIAIAEPHVASLARFARIEVGADQLGHKLFHPRSIVPKQGGVVAGFSKKGPGFAPSQGSRPVDPNHDLLEVIHLVEFMEDVLQGGRADFSDMAGQDKGDRHVFDKFPQLCLQSLNPRFAEAVEGCHCASLKEISHKVSLSAPLGYSSTPMKGRRLSHQ